MASNLRPGFERWRNKIERHCKGPRCTKHDSNTVQNQGRLKLLAGLLHLCQNQFYMRFETCEDKYEICYPLVEILIQVWTKRSFLFPSLNPTIISLTIIARIPIQNHFLDKFVAHKIFIERVFEDTYSPLFVNFETVYSFSLFECDFCAQMFLHGNSKTQPTILKVQVLIQLKWHFLNSRHWSN